MPLKTTHIENGVKHNCETYISGSTIVQNCNRDWSYEIGSPAVIGLGAVFIIASTLIALRRAVQKELEEEKRNKKRDERNERRSAQKDALEEIKKEREALIRAQSNLIRARMNQLQRRWDAGVLSFCIAQKDKLLPTCQALKDFYDRNNVIEANDGGGLDEAQLCLESTRDVAYIYKTIGKLLSVGENHFDLAELEGFMDFLSIGCWSKTFNYGVNSETREHLVALNSEWKEYAHSQLKVFIQDLVEASHSLASASSVIVGHTSGKWARDSHDRRYRRLMRLHDRSAPIFISTIQGNWMKGILGFNHFVLRLEFEDYNNFGILR